MPKHEMVCDGQDEPVTSMPVKAVTDPIMDAPSC